MRFYIEKEKEQLRKEILEAMYLPLSSFNELHSEFLENNNLKCLNCFNVLTSSDYEDLAIVKNKKTNLQGVYLYSEDGYTLCIPLKFNHIDFRFTCFVVKSKNLSGIYSFSGELILPIKYDDISITTKNHHVAIVKKSGLLGLYSLDLHDWILPLEYDDISITTEDNYHVAIVKKIGLVGSYSLDLHDWILPLEYDLICKLHNKVLKVNKGYLWGVYSVSLSKFIIPIQNNTVNSVDSVDYCNTIEFYSDSILIKTSDPYKIEEAYYDYNGNLLSSTTRKKEVNISKGESELFLHCSY